MGAREALLGPVVTIRRVMDFYGHEEVDLRFDGDDENGLVDLMLESQSNEEMAERVGDLDPLLADASVTEQDVLDLLTRRRGGAFENTARASLARLTSRAHDFIDGKNYRPTRSD